MLKYCQGKARQHAVQKEMFLPSFLAGTASAMKMAKVNCINVEVYLLFSLKLQFAEDWSVSCNLFVLLIAPKGKKVFSKTWI